jgi:ADP-heptose:LPS heptosyltransferase
MSAASWSATGWITWLAGKSRTVYAATLAPLVAGLIDEVIEDAGVGSDWRDLFRRPLAGRAFDLVIDTQRRLLTTLVVRRIRHRAFVSGTAGFYFSDRRPPGRYRKPPAMIRQMLDLIEAARGRPAFPHAALSLDPAVRRDAERLLPGDHSYIGLAPGAGGRHKRWPLDRFIAVGRAQLPHGRVPVFLLGPDEADLVPLVREALPEAVLPLQAAAEAGTPVTPMLTIALGERLRAAVANDAGVGHMLAAAERPLVSLFGPTSPAKFAPLSRDLTVITAQAFGGEALDMIPVEAVTRALEALLAPSS